MTSGPVPLAADNFTSLTRTPWGGETIGRRYKAALVPAAAGTRIGESWELSTGPEYPSRLADGSGSLAAWLAARDLRCDLVVKLLDAAEPLSLQVHPRDDDPGLAPDECGKHESWLVLDAAPGAGLFLGFARPLSRAALREALASGGEARGLLHFEAVRPGDYFDIEPGVPHAIGAGVTLLEVQRVAPGKRGKTYRLYDWGRRYDESGRLDPAGRPRAMHVAESLRLVDPERQAGAAFAASLRRPAARREAGGVELASFPANGACQVHRLALAAGARARLALRGGVAAMTVLGGAVAAAEVELPTGRTALLPPAAAPYPLAATAAATCALVLTSGATLELAP